MKIYGQSPSLWRDRITCLPYLSVYMPNLWSSSFMIRTLEFSIEVHIFLSINWFFKPPIVSSWCLDHWNERTIRLSRRLTIYSCLFFLIWIWFYSSSIHRRHGWGMPLLIQDWKRLTCHSCWCWPGSSVSEFTSALVLTIFSAIFNCL